MPYGGARLRLTRRPMVASEAKSIGDALINTSTAATLSLAATNFTEVTAVYMDADRASSVTDVATMYSVMLVTPDVQWYGYREAGTLTAADVGNNVDLNSADGLAVDTTSNNDFHIDKYISADICVGRFNNGVPRSL